MRLAQLFSTLKNKVKNVGSRIGSSFTKIAPKALHYGKMISGGLSHLPGMIGTAAGYVHKGLDVASKTIDSLPESSLKNKLKKLHDNGTEMVKNAETKANNIGNTAKVIGDTAGKILDTIAPNQPKTLNISRPMI